ncbi:MAG: PilW family protein, partial [Pseudomonadales bacterium]
LLQGEAILSEAGRFALLTMGRSLRRAGYRGCDSARWPADLPANIPYEFDLLRGLQGYEATGSSWAPGLAATGLPTTAGSTDTNRYAAATRRTGVNLNALREGTDFFTVWFAGPAEYSVHTPRLTLATGDEKIMLTLRQSDVDHDLKQDHLALIGDCDTESIFMITRLSNSGARALLEHNNTKRVGTGTGNVTARLGTGAGFRPGAHVLPIVSRTFYIGQATNDNLFGAPVFSLFMKEGLRRPVELVEGVEDMQLQYGVARGGASVPSAYLDANQVADFRDVVSVRLAVTANSVDSAGTPAADGILRRSFTSTISLRNRLRSL